MRYIIGKSYNNMVLLNTTISGSSNYRYIVRCSECGEIFDVSSKTLKSGNNFCRNENCKFYKYVPNVFVTGEIYCNLILLSKNKINRGYYNYTVKCSECGEIFTVSSAILRNKENFCKNSHCKFYHNNYGKISKYRTVGSIINSYKIIKVYGDDTVDIECMYCGDKRHYKINTLTSNSVNKLYCRNIHCVKYKHYDKDMLSTRCKYKHGEVVNNLQILELRGESLYLVKCILCGEEFELKQIYIKENGTHCRNLQCRNFYRRTPGSYLLGTTIEGFKAVEYLKSGGLLVECLKCGDRFEVVPSEYKRGSISCKNVKCENCAKYNTTGDIINYVKVLKVLPKKKVYVECLDCGTKFEVFLQSLRDGRKCCTNKACRNSAYYARTVGNCYGDYIAVGKTEKGEFILKCKLCGNTIISEKLSAKLGCLNHPKKMRFTNKSYFGFYIKKWEYTYKDLDYFTCTCEKCGKTDILNVKQMLEHRCK